MTTTDFSRLLRASKILAKSGDTAGAKALIDAATALLPESEVGLCGKCVKRRQSAVEALRQAEVQLHNGAADANSTEDSNKVAAPET